MVENNIQLPETVMLIDAVWLNRLITDLKSHFEQMLNRPLQSMDMGQFIIDLALDVTLPKGSKDTQVLLVYDESTPKINFCTPSVLATELNGVAFRDEELGEFLFASVSPEGMTSREDLFFDLLDIIGEDPNVQKLIVIPSEENCLAETIATIQDIKKKDITLFCVSEQQKCKEYAWKQLAYPIMQGLDIKGDEVSG